MRQRLRETTTFLYRWASDSYVRFYWRLIVCRALLVINSLSHHYGHLPSMEDRTSWSDGGRCINVTGKQSMGVELRIRLSSVNFFCISLPVTFSVLFSSRFVSRANPQVLALRGASTAHLGYGGTRTEVRVIFRTRDHFVFHQRLKIARRGCVSTLRAWLCFAFLLQTGR